MTKVISFGSLNLDLVYRVEHIVKNGETISCKDLSIYPGGKGLNQSLALARAGAEVWHAGGIGKEGDVLIDTLKESGVKTDYIEVRDSPSGQAIIQVDDEGNNCIIINPGANEGNTKGYIKEVLSNFSRGDILVLQNEIDSIGTIISEAKLRGIRIAINPSPLDDKLLSLDLSQTDIIILNEHEARGIIKSDGNVEDLLESLGGVYKDSMIVITMGDKGSVCRTNLGETYFQEAIIAEVVDTTGAGDTFSGYYLAGLIEGMDIPSALKLAAKAASLAVSKSGASSSIPWREALPII